MRANIPLFGPTNESRTRPFSARKVKNFYPVVDPQSAFNSCLMSWPGITSKVTITDGGGCGLGAYNNELYGVWGQNLYRINSSFVSSKIGAIHGSGPAILRDYGDRLIVSRGGKIVTTTGDVLTTLSDTDIGNPSTFDIINTHVVYEASSSTFSVSAAGDPTDVDGFDVASAESNPDVFLRPYNFQNMLYLFGDKTVEIWDNTGVGRPPFARIKNVIQRGTKARHSIAHNQNFMYFMGDDCSVYRVTGVTVQNVTPPAIAHQFENLELSDARGFMIKMEGQHFYVLALSSADRTFVYSETFNLWFEVDYMINSYIYHYGKHLVQGKNNDLFELRLDTYTNDSDEIIRTVETPVLNSGLLAQAPGHGVFINSVELLMDVGKGAVSGQGITPQVMMRISRDGGNTFGSEIWRSSGVLGDYDNRVEWHGLGYAQNFAFRFDFSDPVDWTVFSLVVDFDLGIH